MVGAIAATTVAWSADARGSSSQHVAHHAEPDELARAQCRAQVDLVRRHGRDDPADEHAHELAHHPGRDVVAGDAAHQRGQPPAAPGVVPDGEEAEHDALAEPVGVARQQVREQRLGVERHVQSGGEQRLLAAEPVVDHRGVDAGALGDHPDRRALVSALGELGTGGLEEGGAGVRPAGPPSASTGSAGGALGCCHGSILPRGRGGRRGRARAGPVSASSGGRDARTINLVDRAGGNRRGATSRHGIAVTGRSQLG